MPGRSTSLTNCFAAWNVAVAVLLFLRPLAHTAEPALVIQNVSLFDSVAGRMQPNRTVFILGSKIEAIGTPEKPVPIPEGATILDGKGKFAIPGLIDAHVHLVHRLNFAHMTGDEVLPLFLANGVTSVRDTGDEIVAQTLVARYADAHPELCPRVFRASGLIDGNPPIHRDIGIGITDPALIPGLVEDMAGWGVTTLKIYAGTGRPVGRKVIEEGHRRGLIVTGHLSAYSAQDAVVDGIDCLEHIWSVFDFSIPPDIKKQPNHRSTLDLDNPQCRALVAMLARQKLLVDPTLTVFRNMLLLSDLEEVHGHADVQRMPQRLRDYWHMYRQGQGLAPSTRDRRRQEFQKYKDLTGILHRAGVPLLAGTDSPEPYCPPGFALHQELELLVESGLSPAAALQAATINNARSLKQDDNLGSIQPGKRADLVILTADPTADIRNSRKIEHVIHGGRVCDPETILRAVPRAAKPGFSPKTPAQSLQPIPDKLVVLTFDDASKSHFTVARPLLKKYGFGATFFITEGFDFPTNKRDYMTWEEIAKLHQDGFEIGNHSLDHKSVTRDTIRELAAQLRGINIQCKKHGIPVPVSFAYPGNAIERDALPVLKELGIRFARRGGAPEYPYQEGKGFAYEPGLDHPLLIPSAGDARPGWTLDDFKRAVGQARHGKIAVLQFHGVPDTAHDWVTTSQKQFEAYMQYLAEEQFQVIALRDLAKYVDPSMTPMDPWEAVKARQKLLESKKTRN